MLTFLSPCHRCSVLRQLGCKDGKNWNSKYVISWYMWHKINNTLLSLPPTRCIRIHCFSPGRQSAICLFGLKRHIFVSKLLIDSYLHKLWKWNICRILERKAVAAPGSFSFRWCSVLLQDTLKCLTSPSRSCSPRGDVLILHSFHPMHIHKALMARFKFGRATRKSSAPYWCCHYHLIYVYWFLMCTLVRLSVNFIFPVLTVMLQI